MAFVSSFILPFLPSPSFKQRRICKRKRTRTRIPTSSSSSVPTPSNDPPAVPLSPAQITRTSKHQLLRLLPALINLPKQTEKVATLIKTLESNAVPPITSAFTLLAISGRWRLLFSSALPAREGSGILRIRSIIQEILPIENDNTDNDNVGGTFVNVVTFTYDESRITAKLTVSSKFEFIKANPSRMVITLEGHQVQIVDTNNNNNNNSMGQEESQTMVRELQKGVPAEIWDPSGIIDTTFIEPDLRINRFVGKRLAGVRNIFVPEHTPHGHIPGGDKKDTKTQP